MAGRKSRPKIDNKDINHTLLHEHRKRYRLTAELLYHLVDKGSLTPSLITERDEWILDFMGRHERDSTFARLINRQFTPAKRETITATTDYTKRETYIYNRLHNAAIRREKVTTNLLCADVYHREKKTYETANPDWDLRNTIARIRRKITNKQYHKSKNDKPWSPEDEDENSAKVQLSEDYGVE